MPELDRCDFGGAAPKRFLARRIARAIAGPAFLLAAGLAHAAPVVPCSAAPAAAVSCTATPRTSTPTLTPTPSPSRTATSSPSQTRTPTLTPTLTFGPSNTPTAGSPTATRTATTPTPTLTGTATVTPTGSRTASPTSTGTRTSTPSSTSTPTYTYTPTYTKTPSRTPTCYYEGYCTPTDTPTPTPSKTYTPTMTPTPKSILVYKVRGYPAVSARRAGSPGGLGRFGVKVSGYGDQWIQLQIVRTKGRQGYAIFVDTQAETLWVPGECDLEFLVRGQGLSDLPRNLEVQAFYPAADGGGVASRSPLTVFWMGEDNRWIPQGRFGGPIPENAQGVGKPLFQYLQDNRLDSRNELGVAEDPKRAMRGNALLFFRVHPSGMDPGDFRQGGPFLGFGPTEGFDEMRLRTSRFYVDGCLYPNPSGNKQAEVESSAAVLKDLTADNPDANGDLYIYDYDAPSLPKVFPTARPGDGRDHFTRVRANFSEWATYTDDEGNKLRVSEEFPWYFRASWHLKPNGQVVAEGVPLKDNEVLDGSTRLTYDLSPDSDPEPTIASFFPRSWYSLSGRFLLTINGDFPQGTTGCDWQIELTAPGDPKGDPELPEVGQIVIAPISQVSRAADGSSLRAVFDLRPNGIPYPAKRYRVRVFQGARSAESGPFAITESAFDHWKFDHISQSGDRISIFVAAVDVNGNIVTRPNDPPPVIQRIAGVATTSFNVYGNDGIYYGEADRINPGEQGTITVQASGSGAPTITQTFTVGP